MRTLLAMVVMLLACQSPWAADFVWRNPVQFRGENYNNGSQYSQGSYVRRSDGNFLTTYLIGNRVMLSVVSSETQLLTVANASAANEVQFHVFYSSEFSSRLQRLSNGRILLYLLEGGVPNIPAKPFKLTVYESVNGLGTDFVLKSTLRTKALPHYNFGARSMGQAIETGGRILLPVAIPILIPGAEPQTTSRLYCAISTNGGGSWSFSQIAPNSSYRDPSKGFGIAGTRIFTLVHNWYGSSRSYMASHVLSTLSGTAIDESTDLPQWSSHADYDGSDGAGLLLPSQTFTLSDGNTYLLRSHAGSNQYKVYRRPTARGINLIGQMPYSLGAVNSGATWEGPLNTVALGDDAAEYLSISPSGHLVLLGTSKFGGGAVSHLIAGFTDAIFADGFN